MTDCHRISKTGIRNLSDFATIFRNKLDVSLTLPYSYVLGYTDVVAFIKTEAGQRGGGVDQILTYNWLSRHANFLGFFFYLSGHKL